VIEAVFNPAVTVQPAGSDHVYVLPALFVVEYVCDEPVQTLELPATTGVGVGLTVSVMLPFMVTGVVVQAPLVAVPTTVIV
jgi:hypothetical protein